MRPLISRKMLFGVVSLLAVLTLACSALALPGTPVATSVLGPATQAPVSAKATSHPASVEPTSVKEQHADPEIPSPTVAPALPAEAPTHAAVPAATTAPVSRPGSLMGAWEQMQDLPRSVNALVLDPNDPHVVYAGTGFAGAGGGVYKSVDGGLTWQKTSNGLPSDDVRGLAISATTPATLYASVGHSVGVYASTDGAQTWTEVGTYALSGMKARLLVAPTDARVLFATEDVRGLYRSLDGGRSWTGVVEGLPQDTNGTVSIQSLALDPTNAQVLYAGTGLMTSNGNGVYRSTDGGTTWTAANRGMLDYGITALAVSPANSQVIYAGGAGGELFKSDDGAQTWTTLFERPPVDDGGFTPVRDIAIDPGASDTVYLLDESAGVLVSSDGGVTWQHLAPPSTLDYPTFTSMVVVFGPQPVLLVGTNGDGVLRYAAE